MTYMYTATSGIPSFPEFIIVGLLDDKPLVYYDSVLKKMIPRQEWISNCMPSDYWKRETDISIGYTQLYKMNIDIAKSRFNHSGGVHTMQKMYGCEWNDETGKINGFREEGYDGEDFLSLDLNEMRWISGVQEGFITKNKWDNDKLLLERDKHYFATECTEWLKKYLQYGKKSLQVTVSPQVSLLQKDSSSPVMCHATGFYPSGITISWKKNEQDHDEDVDLGELLPNEDGTYQKTSTIKVKPDEWKKNQYSCVVEHQGKTIVEKEIRMKEEHVPTGIIIGGVVAVALLVIIAVAVYMIYQKKKGFKPVSASDDGSNSSTRTDPKA